MNAAAPQSHRHGSSPDQRAAVVTKAIARAADLLGLTNAALARTIGVSEPTVSRLRRGGYLLEPGTKPYELALLVIRLFRGLDAVTGGDALSLRSWVTAPNHVLGGVPGALIQTVTGLVAAVDYVDAVRARV
jgi:DNA-binding XRE family transcriptional regulator